MLDAGTAWLPAQPAASTSEARAPEPATAFVRDMTFLRSDVLWREMQFPCHRFRASRGREVVRRQRGALQSGMVAESTDGRAAPLFSRRAVALELLTVAAFAAAFLLLFQGRPGYVDVLLAVAAVGFILAGFGRSRRLWQAHRL